MSREDKVLASKKRNDLLKYTNSTIHREVIGKIAEKIKNRQLITDNSDDEKRIFRAQGSIEAYKYVLTIPEKLGKEIKD